MRNKGRNEDIFCCLILLVTKGSINRKESLSFENTQDAQSELVLKENLQMFQSYDHMEKGC